MAYVPHEELFAASASLTPVQPFLPPRVIELFCEDDFLLANLPLQSDTRVIVLMEKRGSPSVRLVEEIAVSTEKLPIFEVAGHVTWPRTDSVSDQPASDVQFRRHAYSRLVTAVFDEQQKQIDAAVDEFAKQLGYEPEIVYVVVKNELLFVPADVNVNRRGSVAYREIGIAVVA